MTEYGDQLLRRPARENWFGRFQVVALVALTLVAIIAQVYIPRLIPNTSFLEIPLLFTIYFSLMRHSQLSGLFFGAFVGLAQDSLSNLPYGMYGIAKTLVGYFAASVSMRFDVDNVFIRFTLTFFFFFFHQFFYWIMRRSLLGQQVPLDPQKILLQAALNSVVAVPLYLILDRMKLSGT
ncbi:MAG: rod shape-determining protein MreD [Bryobacteraceae bacterium]